jgi:hypothetical protein
MVEDDKGGTGVLPYRQCQYVIEDIPYALSLGLNLCDLDLLTQLAMEFKLHTICTDSVTHEGRTYYWVSPRALLPLCALYGYNATRTIHNHLNRLCGYEVETGVYEEFKVEDYPLMKVTLNASKAGYRGSKQTFYAIREEAMGTLISNLEVMGTSPFVEAFERTEETPDEPPVQVEGAIYPTTVSFIEAVLEANQDTFTAPRINVSAPTKALSQLQEYLDALLDGSFMTRYADLIPSQYKGMALPEYNVDTLVKCMSGVRLNGRKMGMADYFLNYNFATKQWHSMFLTYVKKASPTISSTPVARKEATPSVNTPPIKEEKTAKPLSVPKDITDWIESKKRMNEWDGILSRSHTSLNNLLKVSNDIWEWYEAYPEVMQSRLGIGNYTKWFIILRRMIDFVHEGHAEHAKIKNFWTEVRPYDTSNRAWLMFARWVYHSLQAPVLAKSYDDPYITQETGSWNYVDWKLLTPDID